MYLQSRKILFRKSISLFPQVYVIYESSRGQQKLVPPLCIQDEGGTLSLGNVLSRYSSMINALNLETVHNVSLLRLRNPLSILRVSLMYPQYYLCCWFPNTRPIMPRFLCLLIHSGCENCHLFVEYNSSQNLSPGSPFFSD